MNFKLPMLFLAILLCCTNTQPATALAKFRQRASQLATTKQIHIRRLQTNTTNNNHINAEKDRFKKAFEAYFGAKEAVKWGFGGCMVFSSGEWAEDFAIGGYLGVISTMFKRQSFTAMGVAFVTAYAPDLIKKKLEERKRKKVHYPLPYPEY